MAFDLIKSRQAKVEESRGLSTVLIIKINKTGFKVREKDLCPFHDRSQFCTTLYISLHLFPPLHQVMESS
jgi:hypothetical protein